MSKFLKTTEEAEATQEETTTEEVVADLAVEDLAVVVLEATEAVLLQKEKADLEATVEVHLTGQLAEEKDFHLTVQEEKAVFLKELQDVLTLQELMLQEQEDQEKTNTFS